MKRSDRRSAARLAASQALYQMEITGKGLNDLLAEFETHWIGQEIEGDAYTPADPAFFRDVVSGVLNDQLPIDRSLDDTLANGWPLRRVEALMRAILRAALYELRNRPDVPARVAVTEYVDVAAAFFGPEESGMINAVLDALARETRPAEFAAGGEPVRRPELVSRSHHHAVLTAFALPAGTGGQGFALNWENGGASTPNRRKR